MYYNKVIDFSRSEIILFVTQNRKTKLTIIEVAEYRDGAAMR